MLPPRFAYHYTQIVCSMTERIPLLAYTAPAPDVPLRFKSPLLLQTCRRGRLAVQHVAKSRSVAITCDLTACRHMRFVYDSSLREGGSNSQACALRVRLHADFFMCIASSGRKHGGDITVMFRDTQGNATSYGEWQQRREIPAEPVSLSGTVRSNDADCNMLCLQHCSNKCLLLINLATLL